MVLVTRQTRCITFVKTFHENKLASWRFSGIIRYVLSKTKKFFFSDKIQRERQVRARQRHRPLPVLRDPPHLLPSVPIPGARRSQEASLQTSHQRLERDREVQHRHAVRGRGLQ